MTKNSRPHAPENTFTNQINYGNINIGNNRIMKLTSSDISTIQKAHDILAKNYHMSIGEYTNHIKMTML